MAIGDELANLDFQSLIGGPLSAVIKAQAQAAITSVDFIKAVGFHPEGDGADAHKPVMVSFEYMKAVETTTDGTTNVENRPFRLTVPILTMLPIPFIRVEETTIDFNAKITSVQESSVTSDIAVGTELTGKAGWGFGSVQLKANFSYKKSTSSSDKTERTYSMVVHVRAVQDELPAGTERLLGILENAIGEVDLTTPTE